MDLKAIADALAGQFTGVTATLATGPEPIAFGPTATLPNELATGPALLVYHPVGALEIGLGRRRNDHYDFPIRLLRDPLSVPARSDALYAWATAMRDRVERKTILGLPAYVAKVSLVTMRIEIDGITYADSLFDLVELIARVLVIETVSTVGSED